jgi:hypothetical protein
MATLQIVASCLGKHVLSLGVPTIANCQLDNANYSFSFPQTNKSCPQTNKSCNNLPRLTPG